MSTTPYNRKPIPRSILVFGAAAHVGKPLARILRREAPHIRLRLVSTDEGRCAALRAEFPQAEVVQANYFDLPSLERAVEGMEGLFVITPSGTDERPAMTNLVSAVKRADCAVHILRAVGMQPEANLRRLPATVLKPPALGLPVQHPIVKQILDESDLPVTYLNFGATFLDNFFWMAPALRRERKLVWHDRLIPFIDPRDIAEVAARLFLSDNHRHIGQFHTLNNGHDLMRFSDVARLMTEVFGETITHDGSKEAFFAEYEDMGDVRDIIWDFFEYERDNEVVWSPNTFVERMLGRKPITVREWLREHARDLLAPAIPATPAPGATEGAPATAATDTVIDGVWECSVATPKGEERHELTLHTSPDGRLSGEMRHVRTGDTMLLQNGKVSGTTLAWAMQLAKPFKLNLKVEVQVTGKTFAGVASAGMLGKMALKGLRRG